MALPMSAWFCSRRAVVASLPGRLAADSTRKSRVQGMWSSHSLRMSAAKAARLMGSFAEAGGATATTSARAAIRRVPRRNERLPRMMCSFTAFAERSERFEVLDEVGLLGRAEAERLHRVVVVDHVEQSGEPAVVVEAALGVRPQPLERRRAVAVVGRAVGLEAFDADLRRQVHVPAGLGEQRRHVAGGAPRLAGE